MAELFGKADGCTGGRGGSMHLVDTGRHFLGSNGIVGAGLGLAMGAALGMKMQLAARRGGRLLRRRRRQHRPGLGVHQPGRAVEAAADRGVREQPVRRRDPYLPGHGGRVGGRAGRGFGLPAETVDGQDVLAVHAAVRQARDAGAGRARGRPSSRRRPTATRATTSATCRTTGSRARWTTGARRVTHRPAAQRLLAGQGELDDGGFAAAPTRGQGRRGRRDRVRRGLAVARSVHRGPSLAPAASGRPA